MSEINKKVNIIGLVGSILILICVFLPFAKASVYGFSASVTLMDGSDGKLFLAIAILGAIFSFMNKKIPVLIVGVVSCLFTVIEISSFADKASYNLEKGAGFWVMVIGSIVLLVAGILGKKKES